ncbi:MAG TPA: hypothetical protein VFP00_05575, partial [Burkholderiales bacterium]|nr:hypothetical protein [Burkholderiales bacterium]
IAEILPDLVAQGFRFEQTEGPLAHLGQGVKDRLKARGIDQPQPADIQRALQEEQQERVNVAAAQGAQRAALEQQNFQYNPTQQKQIAAVNQSLGLVEALDDFSNEQIDRWVGILKNPAMNISQLIQQDPEFARFQATLGKLKASLLFSREEGGGALTQTEFSALTEAIPTGRELGGATAYRQKLALTKRILTQKLDTFTGLATIRPNQQNVGQFLAEQRQQQRDLLKETAPGAGSGTANNPLGIR